MNTFGASFFLNTFLSHYVFENVTGTRLVISKIGGDVLHVSPMVWNNLKVQWILIIYNFISAENSAQKHQTRTRVLSCPAGRTGERNFKSLLKLLCSHVSQKVLFSSLSYVLLIHLSFLVRSLFSFPLPTGVSSSVPELCSIQVESPAEGDKRLSSDFGLTRMAFWLKFNKKQERYWTGHDILWCIEIIWIQPGEWRPC